MSRGELDEGMWEKNSIQEQEEPLKQNKEIGCILEMLLTISHPDKRVF